MSLERMNDRTGLPAVDNAVRVLNRDVQRAARRMRPKTERGRAAARERHADVQHLVGRALLSLVQEMAAEGVPINVLFAISRPRGRVLRSWQGSKRRR